jgi:hypothetical protein
VERILADIDADHGDFAVEFLGHGVLLCLRCPLLVWLAGRAGARPDHPILEHWSRISFRDRFAPLAARSTV